MSTLDATPLDFWLGDWYCVFEGGTAKNSVTHDFGGHVITEQFHILTPRPWTGMSVSFTTQIRTSGARPGSMKAGTTGTSSAPWWTAIQFGTEPVDVDQTYKRMVFSNIIPETFDLRWESSPDQHEWTENWAIAHVRATRSD